MKLNHESKLSGNLGERKACSFDDSGVHHIMSLLSTIYDNSRGAVLREYAANGLDSHTVAGVDRPVEVILPSSLSPVVTISDSGVGLDREGIENVYARYGASSKRDNNEEAGCFGIGAKSAFSVSNQFTVVGVKDGARTTVVFSLDDGVPGYTIVSEEPTERGNGVTVQIPVGIEDIRSWEEEAKIVFRTWRKGSVLVNGQEPVSIFDESHKVVDNLWWSTDYLSSAFMVSVGGVGYGGDDRLARRVDEKILLHRHAIVELPLGSVDISPDREGLRDTPRTIEAIRRVVDGAIDEMHERVQSEIASQAADYDKVMTWWKHLKIMSQMGVKLDPPECATTVGLGFHSISGGGRSRARRSYVSEMDAGAMLRLAENCIAVVGKADGRVNRMMPRWRKSRDWPNVMLVESTPQWDWMRLDAFSEVISTEDMLAEAKSLPPVQSKPQSRVEYIVFADGVKHQLGVSEIKDLGEVYVGFSHLRHTLALFGDHTPIVELSGGQTLSALTKRLGYEPKDAYEAVREARERELKSISPERLQEYADYLYGQNPLMKEIRAVSTGKLRDMCGPEESPLSPREADAVGYTDLPTATLAREFPLIEAILLGGYKRMAQALVSAFES